MRTYIIRRLLLMVPTLFFVSLIVFFSVRFIPGSIIDLMLREMAEGEATDIKLTGEVLKERLGLNVPVHIQYTRWLGVTPKPDIGFSGVLQGDLGESLWGGWSISDEIAHRFPISLELAVLALLIEVSIAIPLGVFSATRQDTAGDYTGRTIAIAWMSIPGFWLATMVTVYPSIWWNWSPPITYIPLAASVTGNLAQFLLPAALHALHGAGTQTRMTRTMMLEVLRQDYIRTAWAKGLRERTIIYRHALKNALIPVITMMGTTLAITIGGLVVTETIFNLPGMGRLMIEALNKRDYPVVSAINLIMASIILAMNLIVDLSYAYMDPRVAYK